MTRHWDFYCCGCWVSFLFLKLSGLLVPVKRRKLGWQEIYPPVLWSSLSQITELPFRSEDCGFPEVVIWAILNLTPSPFHMKAGLLRHHAASKAVIHMKSELGTFHLLISCPSPNSCPGSNAANHTQPFNSSSFCKDLT